MQSMPAYERDPYLQELATEIVATGTEEEHPFAVLADTVLYPEGGGQPADRGSLAGAAVLDVQWRNGVIRHYLERPVELGPAVVRVDWHRRFDHMQQHTAQHLLTAVAHDRYGWPTTAFHLGPRVCDIELDVTGLSSLQVEALEEAVAEEIRSAHAVTARRVAAEQVAALEVRTRGLPAGHRGDVRLVEIEGVDLNTCGGTHVRCTAELEALKLLGTEPMRGGTRLFFVAGRRVRSRLASHEARSARMRALLGTPDDEIVSAVEGRLERERTLEKHAQRAEDELAAAFASALARDPDRVVAAHFEDKGASFLQRVAKKLVTPGKAALLTASAEGQDFFVLVIGEGLAVDVQAVGREVAVALGGRGGGSGRTFQGKATSLAGRDTAVARLAALVTSG